jgi:3-methyladenine DNA glycosylase Tag
VERLWFVALDVARLRLDLSGAAARCARDALVPAARAAGVGVLDWCVIPCGIRALLAADDRMARSKAAVRAFVRRFTAAAVDPRTDRVTPWRCGARIAAVSHLSAGRWRAFLRRCENAWDDNSMLTEVGHARRARSLTSAARTAAPLIRSIDRVNDAALGSDECAARLRRYVADHDAPADDAVAFARLCEVVFAQGIGMPIVLAKRTALAAAFEGFVPERVAAFGDADVKRLLGTPIIRNEIKIRACIENARRWCGAAPATSPYLARVAQLAAADDAAEGWPALAAALASDFERVGEIAARQTLKRWGFFSALGHPGARRVVDRLGLIQPSDGAAHAQLLLGAIARKLCRDPYALEGALAIFAALGPCKPSPRCDRCGIAQRCPTGTNALSATQAAV